MKSSRARIQLEENRNEILKHLEYSDALVDAIGDGLSIKMVAALKSAERGHREQLLLDMLAFRGENGLNRFIEALVALNQKDAADAALYTPPGLVATDGTLFEEPRRPTGGGHVPLGAIDTQVVVRQATSVSTDKKMPPLDPRIDEAEAERLNIRPLPDDFPNYSSDQRGSIAKFVKSCNKEKIKQSYKGTYYDTCTMDSIKGAAIIVNNEKFEKMKNREGSRIDLEALQELFKELGWVVEAFHDLKAEELANLSSNTKCKTLIEKKYPAYFVIVLSHGIQDYIISTDDKFVHIERYLYKPFRCAVNGTTKLSDGNVCKTPIFFVIQACQEDVKSSEIDKKKYTGTHACGACQTGVTEICSVGSAVPFTLSRRQGNFGSWFIQAYIEVVKRYAHQKSYDDLIKELDSFLKTSAEKQGHRSKDEKSDIYFANQPINYNRRLRSNFFFFPTD